MCAFLVFHRNYFLFFSSLDPKVTKDGHRAAVTVLLFVVQLQNVGWKCCLDLKKIEDKWRPVREFKCRDKRVAQVQELLFNQSLQKML